MKISEHYKPSLAKMQELLLKLAKQQKEIHELKAKNSELLNNKKELSARWEKVRKLLKMQTDDSVKEVFDKIEALWEYKTLI